MEFCREIEIEVVEREEQLVKNSQAGEVWRI